MTVLIHVSSIYEPFPFDISSSLDLTNSLISSFNFFPDLSSRFLTFVEVNYIFYPFLNFFYLWTYSHDQSSFEFSFDFNLQGNIACPYLFFEYYYAFFCKSFQSSSSISSLSFFRPFQIRRKQYYFDPIHESCSFPLPLLIMIRLRLTLSWVVFLFSISFPSNQIESYCVNDVQAILILLSISIVSWCSIVIFCFSYFTLSFDDRLSFVISSIVFSDYQLNSSL